MLTKKIIKLLASAILCSSLIGCGNKWQESGCISRKISYLADKNYITKIIIEINLTEKEFSEVFESTSKLDSLIESSYNKENGKELTYKRNGENFQLLYTFYPSIQVDEKNTGSGQLIDMLFDEKGIPKENIIILERFLCE